jgi:hypothetical protein
MTDDMADRLLARVRRQFRCHEIEFAGWDTTTFAARVGTFRVPDPVVASRMRDRGFRVVGRFPEVLAEGLDAPTDDRGMEMFGRVCQWGAAIVLVLTVLWVVFNGGVR